MKVSPAALLEHARSEEGRKQLRYAGVSVVFVPIGQGLIQLLGAWFRDGLGWSGPYTKASLVTAAILTLPNFFANKLYVWRLTTKDNLRTQILVFWVAAILGVLFATALTSVAEGLTTESSKLVKALVVIPAQLAGFGIVWVARFLVLDKWLFKVTHNGEEPSAAEVDELHHDFPV